MKTATLAALSSLPTNKSMLATKQIEDLSKNVLVAYALWFVFGLLGVHHFYLKRYGWGIIYLLTLGVFGLGWCWDVIGTNLYVKSHNSQVEDEVLLAFSNDLS